MLRMQIIGNLGADPELRYSAQGTSVLTFNVASNDRVRDAEGEMVDQTTWVRITVFGTRADALKEYLFKGMRVYCEGRVSARPWINNQDLPQAGLEIVADAVEFFSPREQEQPAQAAAAAPQRPAQGPASQQRRPAAAAAAAPTRGRQGPPGRQYDLDPADEPF